MLPNLDRILGPVNLVLGLIKECDGSYTAVLSTILEHAAWIESHLIIEGSVRTEMKHYLSGPAGDWFPIGSGSTAASALAQLDLVLSNIPDSEVVGWCTVLHTAIESLVIAEQKYGKYHFVSEALVDGVLRQVRSGLANLAVPAGGSSPQLQGLI